MCIIIGRKSERKELERRFNSGMPEFIAVYGRRRVGKTFLINEMFRDNMAFHHTGLSPYDKNRRVSMKAQLQNFYYSLLRYGGENIQVPTSWMEAFHLLEKLLIQQDNGSRQVVFIDELPWMDTSRSGFLTAFEAFWNGWGNTRHNLCLIVCGSATSWMLDNLINNKGGLYGRLTCELKLTPFTLKECKEFYDARGIKMSLYNIVQAYMILGGIPYYMNYFNPSNSLAQNIDALFFSRNAKLNDEFNRLFNSIFDNAEVCMKIVRFLATRHMGFRRGEIADAVGVSANGDFTNTLNALKYSDFISTYVPIGANKNEIRYKLSDCFCWFWIHFKEQKDVNEVDYWQHHLKEYEISVWRGIAFEEVCANHVSEIKRALNIGGVSSVESNYIVRGDDEHEGMQIDMLINRKDDVVNLCEMKYYNTNFSVSKSYADKLLRRVSEIEKVFPDKSIHLTSITTLPLMSNEYSEIFQTKVTIEDLF